MAAYLSEEQTARRLQELEVKYDLFRYQIDGRYSAWRLLRFNAAIALQNLPYVFKTSKLGWRWLFDQLALALVEIIQIFKMKHAEYVVKTHTSSWNDMEDGKFKDIHFDDFLKTSGGYFKIETLNNPGFSYKRKKALLPPALSTAIIDLTSFFLVFVSGPSQIDLIAREISDQLKNEVNAAEMSQKNIRNTLRRFYWSKRIYKWILRRLQPRVVMASDTGEFSLWAAAHELGIPAIEIQHGVFSRNHPNALPSTAKPYKGSIVVPDRIFLHGDYWKNELDKSHFFSGELVSIGSPHIDHYRKCRSSFLATRQEKMPINLLLTTQGLDRQRLVSFLDEFLGLADTKLDFSLTIKLHPNETDKEPYIQAFGMNDRVRVLLAHELPSTFELMYKSDLHLSIASAAHYDAIGLGVPTVIFPLAGHELVWHLVEDGHAFLPETPRDLLDYVLGIEDVSVPAEVSAYYFKPEAIQNMKQELELLL
jgi:hypothetical protein